MREGARIAGWAIVLAVVLSVATFGMNLMYTARLNGAQHVSFTFGSGLVWEELGGSTVWFLTPQVRVAAGVTDGIDFGFQSGVLTPLGAADPGWLGVHVQARFRIIEVPGSYALAWGVGGGYGLDFFGDGWGIFGEALFESESNSFPIFITYRGILLFDETESLNLRPHWSGGVHLQLTPLARLLLVVDSFDARMTFGIGLEVRV